VTTWRRSLSSDVRGNPHICSVESSNMLPLGLRVLMFEIFAKFCMRKQLSYFVISCSLLKITIVLLATIHVCLSEKN